MYSNEYKIESFLGRGSTGCVYKVYNEVSDEYYALKQAHDETENEILKKEIEILNKVNNTSQYLIKYYNNFISGDNLLNVILEYCDMNSFADTILTPKLNYYLEEKVLISIIYMLLRAINSLHIKNIIHRDIKCRNILLTKKGEIKLCDFGISTTFQKGKMHREPRVGSPYWMSPETILRKEFSYNSDIWSLGITIIEMIEGIPPFSNVKPFEALRCIVSNPPKGLRKYNKKYSTTLHDFISLCLIYDNNHRPSSSKLLTHKIFDIVDKNKPYLIVRDYYVKVGLMTAQENNFLYYNTYQSETTILNDSFFITFNHEFEDNEKFENNRCLKKYQDSIKDIAKKLSFNNIKNTSTKTIFDNCCNINVSHFIEAKNCVNDNERQRVINELYKERDSIINDIYLKYNNIINKLKAAKKFLEKHHGIKTLKEYKNIQKMKNKFIINNTNDGDCISTTLQSG